MWFSYRFVHWTPSGRPAPLEEEHGGDGVAAAADESVRHRRRRVHRLVARQAPPLPWLRRPRHPPRPRSLLEFLFFLFFPSILLCCIFLYVGFFILFLVSDDPKNAFLKQLENAPENLRLFKADVLDGGSLTAAFAGCEGVFHPATPVPEEKTVDPEASIYS